MIRALAIAALLAPGCAPVAPDAPHDAAAILPDVPDDCPGPGREKIRFPRTESCSNDGAVEWCIPDSNNAPLLTTLAAIDPMIHCSLGGGRAMCSTGGKLLCTYPTLYPGQCLTLHGEMKPEIWDNLCKVAAEPDVIEIVPTFLE